MSRVVCWFSAGGPSAVAAKLSIREWHDRGEKVVVAYIDPGSEHPDNARFVDDCEDWFGQRVVRLRSAKWTDTWHVWEERQFILGPHGAICTGELKKAVRYEFQRPDDVQVFGYTADEVHRVERFREQNIGVEITTPLIDRGLLREDCLAMIDRAGLVLPEMYRLGFHNANCVGCPKGGMGYWNKIRVDFPDVFDRMAALERSLDFATHHDESGPVFLDQLDPARGDYPTEVSTDCGILCAIAEGDL